jgi:hypothetical protein
MIVRSVLASAVFAASISANAASWTAMAGNNADYTFVDSASFENKGELVDVDVLRDFNETLTLGNDPDTGAEMYAHRSVKLTYKVDCGNDAIAISEWKMFAGSLGNGEVVWAGKNSGKLAFTAANDEETRALLVSTCATNTASR